MSVEKWELARTFSERLFPSGTKRQTTVDASNHLLASSREHALYAEVNNIKNVRILTTNCKHSIPVLYAELNSHWRSSIG